MAAGTETTTEDIMKIAVAGATGRLGRHVTEVLAERGHEVVPISRATGVDVITGTGLDAALQGVEVVVDAATGPSAEQQPATDFFVTAAHNLQKAGVRAGVREAVVVSIIGTDRFAGGYGAAKVAHEQAWRSGPIPARVVRAGQFHEFVAQLLEWGSRGDVVVVPEMRTQIVAARAVAEVIADVIEADAAVPGAGVTETIEVAGPREEDLVALATELAARQGSPATVEAVRDPGDPDAEMQATGGLLPGPDARLVGPTFRHWLDAR
jgi:uncharacterized protein YbjT (DUF2867 family)